MIAALGLHRLRDRLALVLAQPLERQPGVPEVNSVHRGRRLGKGLVAE